jgi:hypothetical protein
MLCVSALSATATSRGVWRDRAGAAGALVLPAAAGIDAIIRRWREGPAATVAAPEPITVPSPDEVPAAQPTR